MCYVEQAIIQIWKESPRSLERREVELNTGADVVVLNIIAHYCSDRG